MIHTHYLKGMTLKRNPAHYYSIMLISFYKGSVSRINCLVFVKLMMESNFIYCSLNVAEKRLLRRKNLHVVDLKWLENCLESDCKLPEEPYKLQISAMADSINEEERYAKYCWFFRNCIKSEN